jgi:hypothetical protein
MHALAEKVAADRALVTVSGTTYLLDLEYRALTIWNKSFSCSVLTSFTTEEGPTDGFNFQLMFHIKRWLSIEVQNTAYTTYV